MYFVMKLFFLLFVYVFLSPLLFAASIIVPIGSNGINGSQVTVNPGDTILIQGGTRGALDLRDINGTFSQPIIIMNLDTVVHIVSNQAVGIKISNCNHIKLLGNGSSDFYGFKITSNDIGIQVTGGWSNTSGSSDFHISRVEIYDCMVGILAKSDKDRLSFMQKNTIISYSYFKNIQREAIYLGSSNYQHSNDHLLSGVWVHDNIVDSTGWDGIQVGSAIDSCFVFNNYIRRDSYLKTWGQMSGIMLNPGSKCNCFNNFIKDGYGPGIFDQGMGENMIYNNIIINPGTDGDSTAHRGGDGIAIRGENRPYSAGNSIYVFHNTIVNPMNNAVTFAYDPNIQGGNSIIANNLLIAPKGLAAHPSNPANAYIEAYMGASYSDIGNFKHADKIFVQFIDLGNDDLHLNISSPAYALAVTLIYNEQYYDFDSIPRLGLLTPGAYHLSNYVGLDNVPKNNTITYTLFDNILDLSSADTDIYDVKIYDLNGRRLLAHEMGHKRFLIHTDLKAGFYILRLNNTQSHKILVVK